MSSSSSVVRKLRSEDVLTVLIIIVLAAMAGVSSVAGSLKLTEDQLWLITFILFPLGLVTFVSSLRYAMGASESAGFVHLQRLITVFRDWLPFVVFVLFYSAFQLAIWQKMRPATYDAELLAIDRAMMGETPAVTMQRWISPLLSDVLSFCYFLHLVLPPALALTWYVRELRTFRQLLLSVLVAGMIGSIGYALVPAIGPGPAYPEMFHTTLGGDLQEPINTWLDKARAPRDVFPSLHVGISSIVLYFAYRRGRTAFLLLLPFILGNWISTMYLRYHYFIDVIAGWVTAVLAVAGAELMLRLEERWSGKLKIEN